MHIACLIACNTIIPARPRENAGLAEGVHCSPCTASVRPARARCLRSTCRDWWAEPGVELIHAIGKARRQLSVFDPLAVRVALVREVGEPFASLELNLAIIACPSDDSATPDLYLSDRAPLLAALSGEQAAEPARNARRAARDVADTIRMLHTTYGVSSLTVQ